ncbi:hydrolase [Xylariomycetidae sp. FL0641]|nr:hydrolase [Xylariomycetidae sp. FL0641]
MCYQHTDSSQPTARNAEASAGHDAPDSSLESFPWDVGVFDAHCHPTDTMESILSISDMKARALTVMSTRSQDQELVSDVALNHGLESAEIVLPPPSPDQGRVIPSFGWHPWFSYQLYDDSASVPTYDGTPEGKIAHYDKILAPAPSSKDVGFSEGLPTPRALSDFLNETRLRMEKHPFALIGEVGLDKAFRIPHSWTSADEATRDESLTPGGREGRKLSPHRVQMAHQATILKAQLKLAGEMCRAASVHGVQAHGILYDTLAECWKGYEKEVLSKREKRQIAEQAENFASDSESDDQPVGEGQRKTGNSHQAGASRPFPPRICLHSFSGHVEGLKQYLQPSIPAKIFFSFSTVINWGVGGSEKTEDAIRAVPDNRILVESDLHTAGDRMDENLEDVCRKICQIKGWGLREGVERLGQNWREFVFG